MTLCRGLGSRLRDLETSSPTAVTCKTNYRFDVTTASPDITLAISLSIPDQHVAFVEFEAFARQVDGAGRAAFQRSGLFYREGGAVQIQKFWHTITTMRSALGFDVSYTLQPSQVDFMIKAPAANSVTWNGCLHVALLG